jgi:hypothetical protein
MSNARKQLRFNITCSGTLESSEGEQIMGRVADASVSGARFFSSTPLPVGEVLTLRIEVPDREPLIGMMSVVWCEAVEDGYAAGLKAA